MGFRGVRRGVVLLTIASLVASSCGARESTSTEASDRDRNVSAKTVHYGGNDTGIAEVRLGDFSMQLPESLEVRQQADGSFLILSIQMKADKEAVGLSFVISRLTSEGRVDPRFGTDGLVTFRTRQDGFAYARLTRFGTVVAFYKQYEDLPGGGRRGLFSELRSFDAATGRPTPTFGDNGVLPFDDYLKALNVVDADVTEDGAVIVLSSTDAGVATYHLSKYIGTKRTPFIGDSVDEGGSVNFTPPLPAAGGVLTIGDGAVNVELDGTFSVLFGIAKSVCLENVDQPDCAPVPVRRGITVLRFAADGASTSIRDGEKGDAVVWIDRTDATSPVDLTFQISEVSDIGTGGEAHRVITIDRDGMMRAFKMTTDYTPVDGDFEMTPQGVARGFGGTLESSITGKSLEKYVPTADPVVIGLTTHLGLDNDHGTYLSVRSFRDGSEVDSLRLGDYPLSLRRAGNFQMRGGSAFLNVSTIGLDVAQGFNFTTLWSGRSYLKLDETGKVPPAFASANDTLTSPLNGKNAFADGYLWSKTLLAGDGDSFYTFGFLAGPGEGSGLRFQRYVAGGNAGATKDGAPVDIDIDNVSPRILVDDALVFDGTDAVYFTALRDGKFGVAKALLSTRKLDTSYGKGGFTALAGVEPPEPGAKTQGESWWTSFLQLNSDRSVDIIETWWANQQADDVQGPSPLSVRTRHIQANGSTDLSKPARTATTDASELSCRCGLVDPRLFGSIAVDADGRILIAYISRENPESPDGAPHAVPKVMRFNIDGTLDEAFGTKTLTDELGQALLDGTLGFAPQIAVLPTDEILLGFTSYHARLKNPDDLDSLVVDGEYQIVVKLDISGAPVGVKLPPPDPETKRALDASPLRNIGEQPAVIATQPSSDAPAVAAATAVAAAASPLPANTVQISPDKSVRITLATSTADRAIDVRWSVPSALANGSAKYKVTAAPGGQSCTTADTSCVFKKLDPWTAYTFTVSTLSALSGPPADSAPSIPVRPVRVLARKTSTATTKLITPASTGKAKWKVAGGCSLSKDAKTLTTTKDAGLCTLSVTTAKAGKVPKTTRSITIVVRAVAK